MTGHKKLLDLQDGSVILKCLFNAGSPAFSSQSCFPVTPSINMQSLLKKGAIRVSKEQGGFISNIFLVPKDEERWRLILNLKSLNEFVAYEHFKMEDIRCVKDRVQWWVPLERGQNHSQAFLQHLKTCVGCPQRSGRCGMWQSRKPDPLLQDQVCGDEVSRRA